MKNLIRFDYAMKKLLRSKVNFGVLEGFLSELLGKKIKIKSLPDSESNKETKDAKFNRVDVLAQLENGEIVIIEIQIGTQADFLQRTLFGVSKTIVEYMKKGDRYANIKKVYSVSILYFDLGHGEDYIYHGTTSFVGIHKHDKLELTSSQKAEFKKESIHEIHPEYYIIKINNFNDVAKNTLDEWIYLFKNDEIKDTFKARGLSEAKEVLNILNFTEEERLTYNNFLNNLHHEASMTTGNMRVWIKEGEAKGLEKGKKEGEEKTKIAMVINLHNQGINNQIIAKAAGLTETEVDLIIKEK